MLNINISLVLSYSKQRIKNVILFDSSMRLVHTDSARGFYTDRKTKGRGSNMVQFIPNLQLHSKGVSLP